MGSRFARDVTPPYCVFSSRFQIRSGRHGWGHSSARFHTYGVPIAEIQEGIRHGVRKVNIDTDIRLAMTAAMRRTMKKNSGEFDPRKFLQAAIDETEKVCIERFEAFGCSGQAPDIRPINLEVMAQRYRAGALGQVVRASLSSIPKAS